MTRYIGRRIAASIPVLLLASVLVFLLVREFGADPARVRCQQSRDVQCRERAREALGLDDPLPVQYATFMGDFLQGDWGQSQRTDRSVAESIRDDLWETSQLAFWGVLFSGGIALAVGVYSASRPYSRGDYLFTGLAFAGIAMPTFWFGLLTIQYLTFELQQLVGTTEPIFYSIPNPVASGAVEYFRELALPILVLSVQLVAGWSRYQRSSMLEELNSDYIRTARAKGVFEKVVISRHALRNALLPAITVIGIEFAFLIGGLVVTEQVFNLNGIGMLFVQSVSRNDFTLIQAMVMMIAAAYVVINLIVDLLYAVFDPRIRYT